MLPPGCRAVKAMGRYTSMLCSKPSVATGASMPPQGRPMRNRTASGVLIRSAGRSC